VKPVPNFLTFDIEEWYHANYEGVDFARYKGQPTKLESLVDRILNLCERPGVKSTFFVLGTVAEEKPEIVRRIHAAGHEVASHGYGHNSVYGMRPDEFRADLERSCGLLEQITGEKIIGFRAPSFSVRRETLDWYYAILEDAGILYSSSVFPGHTHLYGIPDFPPRIHRPVIASGRRTNVLEIPVPRVRVAGRDIGLYVRLFSTAFIQRRIERRNRVGSPVVLYVHPREIDRDQPRLKLPFPHSLIHYWGIASCERKLGSLLSAIPDKFFRIGDKLAEISA
jgi:polysaccharide deacetylase family protein (PEP-CTERM system associated)